MAALISLASSLINCPSITPDDAGCQDLIKQALTPFGFVCTDIPCDKVKNLWALRKGQGPLFVFAGHTDVVPPGPLKQWKYPPFQATVDQGHLYGRGACDMKGAIAAMIIAVQECLTQNPNFPGSIGFIITSNEEGAKNLDGTLKVVEYLTKQDIKIDYCIVGEPSSLTQIGDNIRVGRRGSLSGKLQIHGKQGHIAYPDKAKNPISLSLPALTELSQIKWDQGNQYFPPTSFQYSHLEAGDKTFNVIPENLEIYFNFRYNNLQTAENLKTRVNHILQQHHLNYSLEWIHSAQPFLTNPEHLTAITQTTIQKLFNITPDFSTSGGTSDARFIAPTGTEVIELGLTNSTIHEINENTAIADLERLVKLYLNILNNI